MREGEGGVVFEEVVDERVSFLMCVDEKRVFFLGWVFDFNFIFVE